MNTFFRFLLIVNFSLTLGCASSSNSGAPGFQKEYPWTFSPYTNAPWTSRVSFNDFIDLEPFFFNVKIRKDKSLQDKKYGYPINALTSSLKSKY